MTDRFGRFRLDRLLGRGGMGEVYEAFDTQKQRVVAVKRLRRELAVDEEFQARFRRESALAARIAAPHVVPVHDYGEIDGQLYLEMQLIRGSDLAALLRAGPLPAGRAVEIVTQVAEALDAAHAEGLVHRDVKPSNVLVAGTARDHAYLVDFGIARLSHPGGTALTHSGATVGTLDYMAPERFQGTGVDHRADVYALTCVLFEALTGRKPYRAGDPLALMYAHLSQPPPVPSAHHAGLTPALDGVVARGMAKDPAARFASAGDLAAAARAALGSPQASSGPAVPAPTAVLPPENPENPENPAQAAHPAPADPTVRLPATPPPGPAASPAPARSRGRLVVGTVAVLAVAAVGAAVAVPLLGTSSGTSSGTGTPPGDVAAPVLTRAGAVAVGSGAVHVDAFGDGALLAATTVEGLTLVVPGTTELLGTVEVPGAEGGAVAVAPDGKYVAVGTASGVAFVDTSSDARLATEVALDGPVTGLAAHPATGQFVAATADGLRVVDPASASQVATLDLAGQKFGLAANPGGDRVYVANADTNELVAVDAGTGAVVATVAVTSPYAVALAPDGDRLYVARPEAVDVVDTADHTVVATVTVPAATDRPDVALSPDGRHAFVTGTGTVTVVDTARAEVVGTVRTGADRDPADVGVTSGGVVVVGTLQGELLTYTTA